MPNITKHIRIGLIVEDRYSNAYRELTQKICLNRVRGYPLKKNKTIPATRKLRAWIETVRDKYDFVFVLVDLDTPMHRKDPEYFRRLQTICEQEGAALLIVKIELESWLLADVESIARWQKANRSLSNYHNTARNPLDPKTEIVKLVNLINHHKGRRKIRTFNPQWTGEIAKTMELNEATLNRNSSLQCFYNLVMGCCSDNGKEYFESYPQDTHCNTPDLPD
ncbi:MAG: DUF4276 family protein [Deltaproteobacteria bacterium]|nr:DUF4276 family protein [Deltaproteobacteria bacterium]